MSENVGSIVTENVGSIVTESVGYNIELLNTKLINISTGPI
jgi:hypothetical protein